MMTSQTIENPKPRVIAWELTRSCNLACAHCRASALHRKYEGELSTDECYRLIDGICEVSKPILILSGGEPLLRPDFFSVAGYAAQKGLRVAVGSNGTLINEETVQKMKAVPVARLGVSIDFHTAALHDKFRGVPGAFDTAVRGIEMAQKAGIEVQINCTLTKLNVQYAEDVLQLALRLGAVAFHPFLLVPTGRGKGLEKEELSPQEYENILLWIYKRQTELKDEIFFKPTDAPHYMRVAMMEGGKNPGAAPHMGHPHGQGHPGGEGMSAMSRGCLAGIGFCFISHVGQVQGCGYLTAPAGNIKEKTFAEVWEKSPLFQELRDLSRIKGKCGACQFKKVCGGCRARAYEATGDYLEAEPYCIYQPSKHSDAPAGKPEVKHG